MDEKFTENNIENNEFSQNTQERDYEILTTRLKDITLTISLLEKSLSK
tara:strand:+ start:301 stop:444 length:144 start_codon:yes stop_codon:yes gene_type:complete